jgi:hypothetical protein
MTIRPNGAQQVFELANRGSYLESMQDISESHALKVIVWMLDGEPEVVFEEHVHHDDAHDAATRDHNIRSAYIHVIEVGANTAAVAPAWVHSRRDSPPL